jgi:hypothetical protein
MNARNDCPDCNLILANAIRQNPEGYQSLARAQPDAIFKLCTACKTSSQVHGADSPDLAIVTDLAGSIDTEEVEAARKKERRMERIYEGVMIALIFATILSLFGHAKKRVQS